MYHITRQNLHFIPAPHNKNKIIKMMAKEWTDEKAF